MDIQELSEKVKQQSSFCMNLLREVEDTVIGQKAMVESILTGILADGHVLLEGLPGLAKTTAVKAFADAVSLDFKRIQFTPDLLPADLLGTTIYNAREAKFETRKGPLFTNLVLADEINRAPSKVQSALLEAMQELCSKPCRNATSRLAMKRSSLTNRSWCLPRRTRLSRKVRIRCRKLRWTVSS